MARHGRNLTAREKKLISELSHGKIDPNDYILIKEIQADRNSRTLHLRHKVTGEEFETVLPR